MAGVQLKFKIASTQLMSCSLTGELGIGLPTRPTPIPHTSNMEVRGQDGLAKPSRITRFVTPRTVAARLHTWPRASGGPPGSIFVNTQFPSTIPGDGRPSPILTTKYSLLVHGGFGRAT